MDVAPKRPADGAAVVVAGLLKEKLRPPPVPVPGVAVVLPKMPPLLAAVVAGAVPPCVAPNRDDPDGAEVPAALLPPRLNMFDFDRASVVELGSKTDLRLVAGSA